MKHYKLGVSVIILCLGMFLLTYAAVPLYSIFCKATGFGGATRQGVNHSPLKKGKRTINIKFDSNIAKNLPWKFTPKQNSIQIIPGENALVFYYAENLTDEDIKGIAIYNVTPQQAGEYFFKIHCFCFEETTLKARQKVLMPVSFYIDPKIEDNPLLDGLDTITLSYSFFKVEK